MSADTVDASGRAALTLLAAAVYLLTLYLLYRLSTLAVLLAQWVLTVFLLLVALALVRAPAHAALRAACLAAFPGGAPVVLLAQAFDLSETVAAFAALATRELGIAWGLG